jgi:hypothetical protein
MVRRVSISQYNSMVRQHNQKVKRAVDQINRGIDRVNRANKQAIDQHNRDIRRYNSEVDRVNRQNRQQAINAVNRYNQFVRSHNATVSQNRRDLSSQISAIRSRSSLTAHYTTLTTQTVRLYEQFERAKSEASHHGGYDDLISLAEREAENGADLTDVLAEEETEISAASEDTGISEYLADLSQDLSDRWKGAVFALNPENPDAARHFCTSAREIFSEILVRWAPDEEVLAANPQCSRTQMGTPTRRSKISYMLNRKSLEAPQLASFVDADIENIVELFNVFNEATHGAKRESMEWQNFKLCDSELKAE